MQRKRAGVRHSPEELEAEQMTDVGAVVTNIWTETIVTGSSGLRIGPCVCVCACVCMCMCVRVCVYAELFSHIQLSATPWSITLLAPLSAEFSKQEYWSGLPFPMPGGLPDPGIERLFLHLLNLQEDSLPLSHQGSSCILQAEPEACWQHWQKF